MKIQKFTPIQEAMMPPILHHQNVIGIAPTGSGKTLAFLIPLLEQLDLTERTQVLIFAPTRELARQLYAVIQLFRNKQPALTANLWIGGLDFTKQIQQAQRGNPQIVVATPKRFLEVMAKTTLNLQGLRAIVLDETDMLFDLGFFPDLDLILQKFGQNTGVLKIATSATLHEMWAGNLKRYLGAGTKVVKVGGLNDQITHNIVWNQDKFHSLSVLLNTLNPYLCLIFANTKKQVEEIYDYLKAQGRNVTKLHGDLQTRERKNRYKEIQAFKYQYVVASDLASRGLDLDGASHVISWNLPKEPEWYLHRAGRAGRQKYTGVSYILLSPEEDQVTLKKLVDKKLKFHDYIIKNNALVTSRSHLRRAPINPEQDQEVKRLLSQKRDVKPGYKKKLQAEIQRINQRHKRAHLEKVIKAKRIEKYKK